MTRAQALDALTARLRASAAQARKNIEELSEDAALIGGLLKPSRDKDEAADALDLLRAQNEAMREALDEYACHGLDECPQHRPGVCMEDACGKLCGDAAFRALKTEPAGWPDWLVPLIRAVHYKLINQEGCPDLEGAYIYVPASLRDAAKEPSNG